MMSFTPIFIYEETKRLDSFSSFLLLELHKWFLM